MKRLKANILSNRKVGGNFYKMELASGYLAKASRPGQFVEVRVSDAGTPEPLLRRPLGVHRIWQRGIDLLYEVAGRGTALLAARRAGEDPDLIGPLGNGFDLSLASDTNILVAGGIGVAPLPALAEVLSSKDKKTFVLIGARTKSHIMCYAEFDSIGCDVRLSTDDGSKGCRGLVTEPLLKLLKARKLETYLPAFRRVTVYACGPAVMLKAVSRIALEVGIPCQVSLEERMACGIGVCLGCPVGMRDGTYKMVCKDGPVFNAKDIAW
ncbi:MAG: dihydroorotate dehydrogenase electron transfer subunit [Candidatus Omnitrophota bacterium]